MTRHVEDGRAFLERTDKRYDLILFALPDSLVLVGGQGSLRLESFLFTTEAFRSARSHLGLTGRSRCTTTTAPMSSLDTRAS